LAFIVLAAGAIFLQYRRRSTQIVRTAKAERQDIHTGVVTNGKAEPIVFREVRAEVDGEVVQLLVREGDSVRRGQKLLELGRKQLSSELEKARAELTDAESAGRLLQQGGTANAVTELKSQLEQARRERDQAAKAAAENGRLVEKGAVARAELEQSRQRLAKAEAELSLLEQKSSRRFDPQELERAQARVQAARAAAILAETRLQSAAVVSPLDGRVYSIAVRAGDYARTGDVLARVGDTARIRVRVFVDEPDLGRVAPAQPVLVSWDGLPGKQWKGAVERLPSQVTELGSRTVGEVSCTLDNPAGELLPNMNLNVEIVTQSKPGVLTVPREAVVAGDRSASVYVVRSGTLVRQPVQTGIMSATRVEIRDGLNEGDEVALTGEQPLEEGMRVETNSG
jgi:multidrug efflux pump subunit AcrA (membrane-fusion protein)